MRRIFRTPTGILAIVASVLGGLALAMSMSGCDAGTGSAAEDPSQANTLFDSLPVYYPGTETLGSDEMRITFLGTSCIPRLSQECNSIFVEVGDGMGESDQFVFDLGTGVMAKYNAMGIPTNKMNKVFLTHLHGDHTSDLTHLYCFGPSEDRKAPLYIFGPSASLLTDPVSGHYYSDDGVNTFCQDLRKVNRWHTESFSFESTSYGTASDPARPTRASWGLPCDPTPASDGICPDNPIDGYALIPIELDWQKSGVVPDDNVAYNNPASGVKITHFPAIHCRQGSISYKLEWNGLSMIFSGDTKPNHTMVKQAAGVDVLIHEMVVPADVWAMKNFHITDSTQIDSVTWTTALAFATAVQNSSHTPQGAFGYILSQISSPPRLTVATHFQAADDTIASALTSVRNHYPTGEVTFAADLMVLNVTKTEIRQRRAVVSNYAFYPKATLYHPMNMPKYHNTDGTMNPYAQINRTDEIPPTDPDTGEEYYREDGY